MHFFTKMKKFLYQEIKIPEGVQITIEGNLFSIKGPEGENKREFKIGKLNIENKGDILKIGNDKSTKSEKKLMNSIRAHVKNMIKGVQEKFEYKLKICSSHFPMTVKVEGNQALIKNFLGEKVDRHSVILPGVNVKVEKEIITITSVEKELAGQTAANFETATKIRNRDRRIFQDGIYIINKAGKEM